MVALALVAVAQVAVSAAGLSGTFLAAAITTAAAVAGRYADSYIQASKTVKQEGPRLQETKITISTEGKPIDRVFGRMRVGTNVIWATRFLEKTNVVRSGGGKGTPKQKTQQTTYVYYQSFAVGLCDGPIAGIGRIWADGTQLDASKFTIRTYLGTESQSPDPKIVATEGAHITPAYKGLAYLVFEEADLTTFGNRMPQLNVEVIKISTNPESLENTVRAVQLLPGSGEFSYDTTVVTVGGSGTFLGSQVTSVKNRNTNLGAGSDYTESMNIMKYTLPGTQYVSVVASWFANDLRAANCQIRPMVETYSPTNGNTDWVVGGLFRSQAELLPTYNGGPLFGGTPNDLSVVRCIQDLKSRGYKVLFYPFIMMDIMSGNGKPDPYGRPEQPAVPWRGRITCHPAAGQPGTVDKTATAGTQLNTFFGTCTPAHFTWNGTTVAYSGPSEWSFRRHILHYAKLCAAAGGVDAFVIGTEMIGITTVRDSASNYPGVTKLKALAADVKSILGSTKISYAADWTEFCNHRPSDGTNDVYFHLDPLWSDSNIDFVGIDNYQPLSDWRDGTQNLDGDLFDSIYDKDYLMGNVEGGELYDWYYASYSDRLTQTRSPITDTTYNEPWVFRYKDVKNWWLSTHHNRPGGVRSGSPTAWTPQSKPIWFTEIGCPAVDKGTNQPNVFYDPKSSERFFPYFSTGSRDDFIQRQYVESIYAYWQPAEGNNPVSTVYGGRMVDTNAIFVWAWDARPYPDFPARPSVWNDGSNWYYGHWLTGRAGVYSLADLVSELCADYTNDFDASKLYGMVHGYSLESSMSVRDAIGPLSIAYFFDGYESEGIVKFVHKNRKPRITIDQNKLVRRSESKDIYQVQRKQETDLPAEHSVSFIDGHIEYKTGNVYARRIRGQSSRRAESQLAIVMDPAFAQQVADISLMETWLSRETVSTVLPPSLLALDPMDNVTLSLDGSVFDARVESVDYEIIRNATLTKSSISVFNPSPSVISTGKLPPVEQALPVSLEFAELPLLKDSLKDNAHAPYLITYARPWYGTSVYWSRTTSGFELDQIVDQYQTVGQLVGELWFSGQLFRWDEIDIVWLKIASGVTLSTKTELDVLNGANSIAVRHPSGYWEVLQFVTAEYLGDNNYKLTKLLRGQLGTEHLLLTTTPAPVGSPVIILDNSLEQSTLSIANKGIAINYKYGPSNDSYDAVTYKDKAYTVEAVGLKPYAPVHITGGKIGTTNDIKITWIRRTRLPDTGDDWELPDVPLGEETEIYDVDVMNGAGTTVVRTFTGLTSPEVIYTTAMQTADFGSVQSSYNVQVFQRSAYVGRGWPEKAQPLTIDRTYPA